MLGKDDSMILYVIFFSILPRIDENGPQLFHMDPSGTYLQFDAKAIGSGSEGAQQSLQEQYHKSITLKEATKTAFTILKQVSDIHYPSIKQCLSNWDRGIVSH